MNTVLHRDSEELSPARSSRALCSRHNKHAMTVSVSLCLLIFCLHLKFNRTVVHERVRTHTHTLSLSSSLSASHQPAVRLVRTPWMKLVVLGGRAACGHSEHPSTGLRPAGPPPHLSVNMCAPSAPLALVLAFGYISISALGGTPPPSRLLQRPSSLHKRDLAKAGAEPNRADILVKCLTGYEFHIRG